MKRHIEKLLSIALLLCVPSNASAMGPYVLTNLGEMPGGTGVLAAGINSHGQVVGYSHEAIIDGVNIPARAFLWTPHTPNGTTGSMLNVVPPPPDSLGSYATGINDLGQIVGFYPHSLEAFLWTPSAPNSTMGSNVVLGSFLGYPEAQTAHINALGQFVGSSGLGARAFLWSPNAANGSAGSAVGLGDPPGMPANTAASGINAIGQVVGSINPTAEPRSFLWTPSAPNGQAGNIVELGELPGGFVYNSASDINSRGQVVGSSSVTSSVPNSIGLHAYLWNPDSPNATTGGIFDLGTLPGFATSSAAAINSSGQVVGMSFALNQQSKAFVWTPSAPNGANGEMVELQDLVAPQGRIGWTLLSATAINDLGQIVGNGLFDPDGPGGAPAVGRAFLLTPVPEAATTVLMTTAVGWLMIWRRRI
jgi:probable HAF family extracellular repeat protein